MDRCPFEPGRASTESMQVRGATFARKHSRESTHAHKSHASDSSSESCSLTHLPSAALRRTNRPARACLFADNLSLVGCDIESVFGQMSCSGGR